MVKKKKNSVWYIMGVLVIVLLIILIAINSSKSQQKETLTEDDFKILGVAWDSYKMNWNNDNLVPDINQPIDYEARCNYCKTGFWDNIDQTSAPIKERCSNAQYHLTIEATESLVFNVAIDGINVENLQDVNNDMGYIASGTITTGISLSYYEQIVSNLDMRESHEFTLCATDSSRTKGFICKSITLPAKC